VHGFSSAKVRPEIPNNTRSRIQRILTAGYEVTLFRNVRLSRCRRHAPEHPAITMASLFVRSLTRSTRTSTSLRSFQYSFSTAIVRNFEQRTQHDKPSFDYHTVEDLQGMTAQEILAESGTRQDEKMRHFTGMCGWAVYSSVNPR